MPGEVAASRIRLGILALPIAGALELATALLVWNVDTRSDRNWAELAVSTRYEAAQFVDILSLVLYLFGVFALYAYLNGTRAERWALAGLVFGVVYTVSVIVVIASDTAVEPLLGRRYLEGDSDVYAMYSREAADEDVLPGFSGLTHGWSGYASFVLFGVAIWRSGLLPQGAVILLLAFAVLTPVASEVSASLGFLGYGLMVIAEAWVAWSVWRQLSPTKPRPRLR